MSNARFRKELSAYVKPNTTRSPLGMPCFGMGIPTPVSFVAPTVLRYINMAKTSKNADRRLLAEQSPYLLILTTKQDTERDWILAGKTFQHLALMAAHHGWATHPLAAAIQIGNHFQRLQKFLQTKERPQIFFRLGKPSKPVKRSPRLQAMAVTKQIHA
jgi:hypothetical protein